MAEFKDVIKQKKRMCMGIGKCGKCPLHSKEKCNCRFMAMIYAEYDEAEVEAIERIVMDWAANNPEPRYPSWAEWQKANFPNALHSICPNYFMWEKPLGTCAVSCAKCTGTPIPADIAEKLNIKPVDVTR